MTATGRPCSPSSGARLPYEPTEEEEPLPVSTAPMIRGSQGETIRNHAESIRTVAHRLRGPYRPVGCRTVILLLTGIRRLDCLPEQTNRAVPAKRAQLAGKIARVTPGSGRSSIRRHASAERLLVRPSKIRNGDDRW